MRAPLRHPHPKRLRRHVGVGELPVPNCGCQAPGLANCRGQTAGARHRGWSLADTVPLGELRVPGTRTGPSQTPAALGERRVPGTGSNPPQACRARRTAGARHHGSSLADTVPLGERPVPGTGSSPTQAVRTRRTAGARHQRWSLPDVVPLGERPVPGTGSRPAQTCRWANCACQAAGAGSSGTEGSSLADTVLSGELLVPGTGVSPAQTCRSWLTRRWTISRR